VSAGEASSGEISGKLCYVCKVETGKMLFEHFIFKSQYFIGFY